MLPPGPLILAFGREGQEGYTFEVNLYYKARLCLMTPKWAIEVTHQLMALAAKPHDLSLVYGTT